jgi:hypothetical protein
MDIERDIRLSGFASFVGKSSAEVTLKIDQVQIEREKKKDDMI